MIFVCVYKSGGDYDPQYVKALRQGLEDFCPEPFKFWCFTDQPQAVIKYCDTVVRLLDDLPGWWSKLEIFRPIYNREKIVYLDLDVLIMKDLSEFIKIIKNTEGPLMLRSRDPIGHKNDWPSSSIMSWSGTEMTKVYEEFSTMGYEKVLKLVKNNPSRAGQRTDQGFIRSIINPVKFQDFLPEDYILFKVDYWGDPTKFKKAVILNWTGKPRFHKMGSEYNHIFSIWKNKNLTINENN